MQTWSRNEQRDVRIIIVNRANITLVVLAQRIIFLHFSCFRAFFLWKLEEVGELRSSKRLHVRFHVNWKSQICASYVLNEAKRKRKQHRIGYFRILFLIIFYPSPTKSQFCITRLYGNLIVIFISALLLIFWMIFIIEFYNRRVTHNVQNSLVEI